MRSLNRQLRRPRLARDRSIAAAAAAALCAWVGASSPARADNEMLALPVLRLAIGPAVHVEPEREVGAEVGFEATTGFVGIFGNSSAGFVINPEIGYAYDSLRLGVHAFSATCGVGFGGQIATILYHPRLLLGSAGGDLAIGMRNGISLRAFLDVLGLEVAHQMVHTIGVTHHDIRILFGINVGAFAYAVHELSSNSR